tara:strand:- start:9431 stop:9658 length:228 start_codon:yes stop_codon:yes gene_type:complete
MAKLIASAQLLTIVANKGLLKVEMNENPLRETFANWQFSLSANEKIKLLEKNGIGEMQCKTVMKWKNIEVSAIPE